MHPMAGAWVLQQAHVRAGNIAAARHVHGLLRANRPAQSQVSPGRFTGAAMPRAGGLAKGKRHAAFSAPADEAAAAWRRRTAPQPGAGGHHAEVPIHSRSPAHFEQCKRPGCLADSIFSSGVGHLLEMTTALLDSPIAPVRVPRRRAGRYARAPAPILPQRLYTLSRLHHELAGRCKRPEARPDLHCF